MMKPVLQAMAEGVDPVLLQFAADLLAERAVERRNVEVISGPFI